MAEISQILKQATGVLAARGEGVLLYDEDYRRYLDFTAGIGVTSTGHCHPRVVEAAQRQVGTLIHAQSIPALVVSPNQIDEAAGIWADAVSAVLSR